MAPTATLQSQASIFIKAYTPDSNKKKVAQCGSMGLSKMPIALATVYPCENLLGKVLFNNDGCGGGIRSNLHIIIPYQIYVAF